MIAKELIDGTSLDRTVRSKVLIYFVCSLFLILIARIAFIQLVEGERNLKRSIKNRVFLETVKAERGLIYDREGRVLARNRPSYSLFIHPGQVPSPKPLKTQLLSLVDTAGLPIFQEGFVDSIFKAEKELRKKSIGSLDFNFTQENLVTYLLNLTDKGGTPFFDLLYLDSLFSNRVIHDSLIESVALDNSLPYLKAKLLKIYNSEGKYLIDSATLENRLEIAYASSESKSRLAEDVSIEFVSIIQERIGELDGVFIEMEPRREYTYGEHLFHVLGYLGRMDSVEAKTFLSRGYERSDKVGKQGIEKQYESLLRGVDGCRYVEKNVRGRKLGVIEEYPSVLPEAGNNIYLTIDAEMQKRISEAIADTVKGAVVVLNPKNGEVLALVSNPSFDANIFSSARDERDKEWENANNDKKMRPLRNKAIKGKYPPGSTFKLITGLAVVDSGDITTGRIPAAEKMPQQCTGTFHFGNTSFDCWRSRGHGAVDLVDAIKSSCNVYFYQVGLRIGYKTINHYAEFFNLKEPTGIDIPGELGGYLSGKEAHNKRRGHLGPGWRWTRGLMMNLSIGQSQELTPLQVAMIPAGFATGNLYRPHVLMEERTSDNTFIRSYSKELIRKIPLKDGSLDAIKEGMFRVCNSKGGTGSKTKLDYLPVGGKSGSSENPHGEMTHALFVTLAPLDDPEIAISVVLENVGHGGAEAAPISKIVLDYYFEETAHGRKVAEKYSGWDGEGWRQ